MRSNRSHLGSRHLALEPGRVRYSVVKGKAAGRSTPGYPAASMIGGMSVVMDLKDVEKEVVSDPLTIDFMWAVAQTAARSDDSNATEKAKQATADAKHMFNCWADQAYERGLKGILEYADLPADLGPSTLGHYIPVLPETQCLRLKLSMTLYNLSAEYFEPPLDDGFMRLKYHTLYFFELADAGYRFVERNLHKRRQRSGERDAFGRLLA